MSESRTSNDNTDWLDSLEHAAWLALWGGIGSLYGYGTACLFYAARPEAQNIALACVDCIAPNQTQLTRAVYTGLAAGAAVGALLGHGIYKNEAEFRRRQEAHKRRKEREDQIRAVQEGYQLFKETEAGKRPKGDVYYEQVFRFG